MNRVWSGSVCQARPPIGRLLNTPVRRPAVPRWLRTLARDRTGVTALEFALISPAFFFLLFAIFELSLQFLTQTVLEHAVAIGTRQIQIGNATTLATFQADICAAAPSVIISSCSSNLQIYVTSGSLFSALKVATVSSAGTLSPTTFSPGTAGSDLLVQVVYNRPFFFSFISLAVGRSAAATMSVVAVQNEPF